MKKFTKMMKIRYRSIAKNSGADASALVCAGQVFGGFEKDFTEEELQFLESCNSKEWTPIPKELNDSVASANFYCYVKLVD